MSNIRIVTPQLSDWKKYRSLKLEALREEPYAFATSAPELENLSDDYWRADLLKAERGRGLVLWAQDQETGEPVGMVSAFWGDRVKQNHQATILWVYLRKEYRGQGISRQLMTQLLAELVKRPNLIKAYLTVMEKQLPARNLYKSLGFVESGKISKSVKMNDEYLDEYILEIFF